MEPTKSDDNVEIVGAEGREFWERVFVAAISKPYPVAVKLATDVADDALGEWKVRTARLPFTDRLGGHRSW